MPALIDVICSSFLLYGYVLWAASVISMLNSLQLIFGSILSILFLGKILYRHHLLGLLIILLGLVVVIFAVLFNTQKNNSTTLIGVICVLMSAVLMPIQNII